MKEFILRLRLKEYLLRLKKPILFAAFFAFTAAIITIARAPQADTRIVKNNAKKKEEKNAA